jgi:hypothetical protein
MQNLVKHHAWLLAMGWSLTLCMAHAQNAPAPGTTAIPAARPAPGNAGTTAQTKPAAPAPQPAATAPKAPDAAKSPTPANKAADTKPANATAAPSPQAPAADPEPEKTGEAAPVESPKKKAAAEPPPCIVADFRAIGIDTQDAEKRRAKALAWINRRGKQCTPQQLLVIRNNRAQWLGAGDSAAAAASIDSLLEVFAATNPDIAMLLYGTPPPPPPPPDPKAKKPPPQ